MPESTLTVDAPVCTCPVPHSGNCAVCKARSKSLLREVETRLGPARADYYARLCLGIPSTAMQLMEMALNKQEGFE